MRALAQTSGLQAQRAITCRRSPKVQCHGTSNQAFSRRQIFGAAITSLMGIKELSGAQKAKSQELLDFVPDLSDLDTDGDGFMSENELLRAYGPDLESTAPRQYLRETVMPVLDFNGDGKVSLKDEFARSMVLDLPVDQDFMDAVDLNGDSYVSFRELSSALGDFGEAGDRIIRVAFKMSDLDPRDGRLSLAETERIMSLVSNGLLDPSRLNVQKQLLGR